MEPLTLAMGALIAVASGVTAGATGKLGEDLMTKAQGWWAQLQRHSPDTAKRLAGVSDPNVIDVEILEEVKRAAQQPDVQAAMDETVAAAATADASQFPNLTKLADSVGNVFTGNVYNPTFNQTF
ncbi:MAG: hypothetical protein AAF703_07475 [Cyanobacteria bacterium P01_D01_bin.105]